MITLPDFNKAFDYENDFYLSCDITRISKMLAHYQLYMMTRDIPGALVECGVFKGVSLIRFATFREIFDNPFSRKIIGFDSFGAFPKTTHDPDIIHRQKFIDDAGNYSITTDQLNEVLDAKNINQNIELVGGDINITVPKYVKSHPELKISLLNLDTDVYEPAVTVLEQLAPRMVKGGVIVLDDYGTFPGETKAVDDYFKEKQIQISKFPFCKTPCYVIIN